MAQLSPLRLRMIGDMQIRNLSPATQRSYIYAVLRYSRFFGGRSPARLTLEDARSYLVHLAGRGLSWSSLNQTVAGLRFFLRRDAGARGCPGHDPVSPPALPVAGCPERRRG